MKTKTLCIIQTGEVNRDIQNKYSSYGNMFTYWLKDHLPQWSFDIISIINGAPLPEDVCTYQAYLITGSRLSAYDDIDWIADLEKFIITAQNHKIPVIGVCFGHQIIAKANGGTVEKSSNGWGLGTQTYQLNEKNILNTTRPHDLTKDMMHYAYHQDQVIQQPSNSTCLAGNDHCSLAILEYDCPSLSFQFHPEFTREYVSDLIDLNAGKKFSQEFADITKKRLCENTHNEHVGQWISQFLDKHTQ